MQKFHLTLQATIQMITILSNHCTFSTIQKQLGLDCFYGAFSSVGGGSIAPASFFFSLCFQATALIGMAAMEMQIQV